MYIKHKIKLTPVRILALGFFVLIIMGTFLLMLPISSKARIVTPFIDALFTSSSALCITGLVTLNTAHHWSYFGTTIIMTLIQVGGLGFISFATLFTLILGKKITLRERLIMQEAINSFSMHNLVELIRYIVLFTFFIEGVGALILAIRFIPHYGLMRGIYLSIFYAISAFCNAGFELTGSSLVPYAGSSVIILTISALIVIGGLGFPVWIEVYNYKKLKKISIHSRLVMITTLILILSGWILMFILEIRNPETLQAMSLKNRLLNSLFASIVPRSGGFNSITTSDMTLGGITLTIALMFIGGSPGGTAGGVKTTTVGILIMTVFSIVRNREDTQIFKRTISKRLVYKSFAIFTIIAGVAVINTIILSITEIGVPLEHILFEAVSATTTVGLSLGLTPKLTAIGKLLITFTMYWGRIGPLTLFLALSNKKNRNSIKYPDGEILVG